MICDGRLADAQAFAAHHRPADLLADWRGVLAGRTALPPRQRCHSQRLLLCGGGDRLWGRVSMVTTILLLSGPYIACVPLHLTRSCVLAVCHPSLGAVHVGWTRP
eukprot:SAG22_NODE_1337_length_4697_cov_2.318182_3_plen_105_part_00